MTQVNLSCEEKCKYESISSCEKKCKCEVYFPKECKVYGYHGGALHKYVDTVSKSQIVAQTEWP